MAIAAAVASSSFGSQTDPVHVWALGEPCTLPNNTVRIHVEVRGVRSDFVDLNDSGELTPSWIRNLDPVLPVRLFFLDQRRSGSPSGTKPHYLYLPLLTKTTYLREYLFCKQFEDLRILKWGEAWPDSGGSAPVNLVLRLQ